MFVLDTPKVPENTRFDVSRLVKPNRHMILQKVSEKQEFDSGESCLGKIDNIVEGFEENVLCVLREFEKGINCIHT